MQALEHMIATGIISGIVLVLLGLVVPEKHVGKYIVVASMWELLWLGPPLFHIWVKGVLG